MLIKLKMIDDFSDWCKENKVSMCLEYMIEFMVQRKYLKGKQFSEFCDNIPVNETWISLCQFEPLREGFIPPGAWIK